MKKSCAQTPKVGYVQHSNPSKATNKNQRLENTKTISVVYLAFI